MQSTKAMFTTSLTTIFVAATLSLFTGCTADSADYYNDEANHRISMLTDTANDLLFSLEDTGTKRPECEYAYHADRYRDIRVQLKNFQMYETVRPQKMQLKQIEALQKQINELVAIHRKQCLSPSIIKTNQDQINALLGQMLKLEVSQ